MTTKTAFRIRQTVVRVEERHMKPDETVLQADILLAAAAECDNGLWDQSVRIATAIRNSTALSHEEPSNV